MANNTRLFSLASLCQVGDTHTHTLSDVITEREARRKRKTGLHVIVHIRLHVHVQAVIGHAASGVLLFIQSVLFWLTKTKSTFSKAFYF